MAEYTITIKTLCDLYGRDSVLECFKKYELSDFLSQTQLDTINKLNIWSKDKLAEKIVDRYFMREIGFETFSLFKHYAKVEMLEIMEEYSKILYSNSLEYDPLESVNFDITESREIQGTGSTESEGNSNSTSASNTGSSNMTINSDTPQGQISKEQIKLGNYATSTGLGETENSSSINDNTSTNNSGTTNSTTTETFTHKELGNKGVMDSYQKMVLLYRDTIRSVDKEIIERLNVLFMGIY